MTKKYLLIGDLHLRPLMPYGEYLSDGRKGEKERVFNALRGAAKDCQGVIFLGDQLNSRHNNSEVIREFTELVESFGNKEIFITSGNHETTGDGKTAIDYLREVKKPNWHIITNKVETIDDFTFLPYFYKGELGVKSNEEAKKKIMKMLPKEGKILFTHMTVSGMKLGGILTDALTEVVLNKKELEKRFTWTFNGHIHESSDESTTVNVGSTFSLQVGDTDKRAVILEMNSDGSSRWRSIEMPIMPIVRLENPQLEDLANMQTSFVKAVFTRETSPTKMKAIKDALVNDTYAHVLIEQYSSERNNSIPFDESHDLNLDNLLAIYAQQREIDLQKLIAGYEIIKS